MTIPQLTFRHMPDPEGDSATFLNFFLPSAELAQKVMSQFEQDAVGGCAYWYTNMYHFINQWDHLKDLKVAAPLAINHLGMSQDFSQVELPKSQDVIGRLISLGIRATWTEEEAQALGEAMKESIQKAVAG